MGQWTILVHGTGAHHNGSERDADQMAARFADALKAAGHFDVSASITYGARQDLLNTASRLPLKELG